MKTKIERRIYQESYFVFLFFALPGFQTSREGSLHTKTMSVDRLILRERSRDFHGLLTVSSNQTRGLSFEKGDM